MLEECKTLSILNIGDISISNLGVKILSEI